MLPVLVCAGPSLTFVAQDKEVVISSNSTSYNDKNDYTINPYEKLKIEINNPVKFTIKGSGAWVEVVEIIKNRKQKYQITTSELAFRLAGQAVQKRPLITAKDSKKHKNIIIGVPDTTATIGAESPLKDANSVLIVGDKAGQVNNYKMLEAQFNASGIPAEIHELHSYSKDEARNTVTSLASEIKAAVNKFYDDPDRKLFLTDNVKNKKITIVIDFDHKSRDGQSQEYFIDFARTIISQLSLDETKNRIERLVFISHTQQDDKDIIAAISTFVSNYLKSNSNATPFTLAHKEGNGEIHDILGVAFQTGGLGSDQAAPSGEPTMAELERQKILAKTKAAEAQAQTHQMHQAQMQAGGLYPGLHGIQQTSSLPTYSIATAPAPSAPEAEENKPVIKLQGDIAKLDKDIQSFNEKVKKNAKFLTSGDQGKRDKALQNATALNEKIKALKTTKETKETELAKLQNPAVEETVSVEGYQSLSEDEE